MECWAFELLGGVRATSPSHRLEDFVGKKPGALLALLALHPGKTRAREEVIDLIWPEVDYDEARNRLRQTIFVLRKQLEPEGVAPGSVLFADRTQLGLTAEQTSDVAAFQQHLRWAALTTEPQERVQHLQAALALYKGEFAPGFYLDVLLTERERLKVLAQSARDRLAALEAVSVAELPRPIIVAPVRTENRFFGRTQEREHLRCLLQDFRLVTLIGPGGTGKTRLVQELSVELPGARFIGLSALRNGASIPEALVAALALPDSTERALTRLQAAFADKPTLLILDNVEQLVASGGAEAIAHLLDVAPTLRLLVTSRLRLDLPQETVCPLAPLAEEEAVALFVDRARLATSRFVLTEENTATVGELCRRLDGLPLAIELAAARMAVLSPPQILERLARRFDLLADKRRDREDRHASLRAALDWGWSLLAPDVQRFFTQLCLFRGSFSLEAAEAVTEEPLAIDYLQSLADGSFLLCEGERFRLLETLREYGLEKLRSADSTALTQTHAQYYLHCLQRWEPFLVGSEVARGIHHFKQDQDNIHAALERTLAHAPDVAVSLCLAANPFWKTIFCRQPALEYLSQALERGTATGISEERLVALHGCLGPAYLDLGNYREARVHQQQSYEYHLRQRDTRRLAGETEEALRPLNGRVAEELNNLGNLLYFETHFDEAVYHFEAAVELNRSLGDDVRLARNYSGLFCVFASRGYLTSITQERRAYFELAQSYAEEGTAVCRRAQLDFSLCFLLRAQAFLLPLLGRVEEARPLLAEGFLLCCQLENWPILADYLTCYYHQSIRDERWEEAAQFQGAEAALRGQWNTHEGWEAPPDEEGIPVRPYANLPALLGKERYELLFEAGTKASLEALQTLATRLHSAPVRQPQAY